MRIKALRTNYIRSDFYRWLTSEMKAQGKTQSALADVLGIKQPQFSKKIRSGSFSLEDIIKIFAELKTDAATAARVLGVKGV